MRYVYILRCKGKALYTGITNDLEKRIFDHNNPATSCGAKYTRSRRPVKLARSKRVKDKVTAMKLEYATKRIGKEAKEGLIIGYAKARKGKSKKTTGLL